MSKQLTIYHYPQCGTCRKAIKWLEEQGHQLEKIHIVDEPPTEEVLQRMISQSGLPIQKFFNTSGQVYREENLKEQLPRMTESEKIAKLSENGKLIKRPIVTDGETVTVGFKETDFEQHWNSRG